MIAIAIRHGVALEVNGLPDRLDLAGPDVRLAVEAGVPVVVSTDAHSVRGLGNMRLAVATRAGAGPRRYTCSTPAHSTRCSPTATSARP